MNKLVIEYTVKIEREVDDDFREEGVNGIMLDDEDLIRREKEYFKSCVEEASYEYSEEDGWNVKDDLDIYMIVEGKDE